MEIQSPRKELDGVGDGGDPVNEGAVCFVVAVSVPSFAGNINFYDVVTRGGFCRPKLRGGVFGPPAVYHIVAEFRLPHHFRDVVWVVGVVVVEPVAEVVEEPAVEEGFDPDAKDIDGDGFLQDGTPFQRPVEEK